MAPEEGVVPILGPGDPGLIPEPTGGVVEVPPGRMAPPRDPITGGDGMVAPESAGTLPIEFVP